MKAFKFHQPNADSLRAIKDQLGCTYDEALTYVFKRHADSVVPILSLAAQLDRMETELLEIRDLLRQTAASSLASPQTFVVQ